MFSKENTFVISLKKRQDRRERCLKEIPVPFQFFDAVENENGTIGCALSHLSVIKKAKELGLEYVFIMEDDALFLRDFEVPELPHDWEMLFFGGAVNKIYDEYYYHWKRVSNWYAHAYVVKKEYYDEILSEAPKYLNKYAIDEYYCEILHPKINSYVIYPTLISQKEDYSDIERCQLDRHQKIMNFDVLVEKKNPNPKTFQNIYCLNLKERDDKYEQMKEVLMKENLKVNFYRVNKHEQGGKVGCLTSHLEILKEAKKRGLPNVLILEDDIEFVRNIRDITLPETWDMFYLGGNFLDVLEDTSIEKPFYKIRSFSTYAYAVNGHFYDKLIDGLTSCVKEIDKYYLENIHPNYQVFMCNPVCVIPQQDEIFSDVEGKTMNYDFVREKLTLTGAPFISQQKEEVSEIIDYPSVSIITPTINRKNFHKLILHNFFTQDYPREKMELIIIDEGDEPIEDLLPADDRIKYFYISEEKRKELFQKWVNSLKGQSDLKMKLGKHKILDKDFFNGRLPIGMKRNIGVSLAKNPVIIHMDDDDYYPVNSVKNRVSRLGECVCCSAIANFNIVRMISMVNVPPFDMDYSMRVSEASMCYLKSFWEERKFQAGDICSEGEAFLRGRTERVKDLDWKDVIISLRHQGNFTSRNELTEEPNGWHFGKIKDETFLFLTSLC